MSSPRPVAAREWFPLRGRERVAVCGFWEENRDKAPFGADDALIVGLNHLHPYIPRWDVWFDMHTPEWSAANMKPEVWADQEQFLKTKHDKPVFMLQAHDAYPDSQEYPLEAVAKRFRPYFTNGLAYIMGLLLLEHVAGPGTVKRLEIWGADMSNSEEYAIQRPCFEYWLGIAEGLGIDVFVPPESALLSAHVLYGYAEEGGIFGEALRAHQRDVAEIQARREKLYEQVCALDGAIQANQRWLENWSRRARGGTL